MKKLFSLLLILFLAGCTLPGGMTLPAWVPGQVTATPPVVVETAAPSGPTVTVEETQPLPTPTQVQVLTLWVPPDFDPAAEKPAGKLLAARLREFSRQNAGYRVNVRVKAASGAGGLLESLNAASGAAPGSLPSVIALSRPDIESAALKGLIAPLDGTSTAIDEVDWYNYARQLAMVQGTTYALPFAGDALVLAYRPAKVFTPPVSWEAIYSLGQPVAFPAGDPQALFVLALYQSVGGAVEDAQRRPTLQADPLSKIFQVLADGEERGIFPSWLIDYETSAQVWQSFRDLRVNALFTWASNYLSTLPPDTTAVAIPALEEKPLTLATGWGWAVSDPVASRRGASIRLVEFLSDAVFLAEWTEAAGYLPTRPSSLEAWTNQDLKTMLGPVAASAQARPTSEQLSSLGSVLKVAAVKLLKEKGDPTQAAQSAAERLAVPENR